jgi:hypothetical protein
MLERYALLPSVHVESSLAQEPHQRHTVLPCYVDREAARGGDGAHEGHARREALLQDLEAAAPADQDDVPRERQPAFQQRPPDELVRRVVTADVLPERDEVPLRVEERRGVQAAGRVEEPLRLPELFGQGVERLGIPVRSLHEVGAAEQLQ